jgi:hypothetical protein
MKSSAYWEAQTIKAAEKLIRTGQLLPVGGGIYRFAEYVDDLDTYVAQRSARIKKPRIRNARTARSR